MPEVHAKYFNASASGRWLNCLGSVLATADKPNRSSADADYGTLVHLYCSFLLECEYKGLIGDARDAYLNQVVTDPNYNGHDKEVSVCGQEYLEYVKAIMLSYPQQPHIFIEQRVDYSKWADGGFGTSDCIIITPTDIHIVDYKNGKGVPVSSEDNSQLKLYALGALNMFHQWYPGLNRVVLHIVQPRIDNNSSWETTPGALYEWGRSVVKPATIAAMHPDAPFTPGEKQCRFCAIKATCRARAKQNLTIPFAGQYAPELTAQEVADAIRVGKDIVEWYNAINDYAQSELLAGKDIPGFKLVAGRATRGWCDQSKAFETLKERGVEDALLYERVPLTAPKLEKSLGKKMFGEVAADLVEKKPGKPTMVPETDKRDAWQPTDTMFNDETKGEK